MSGIDDDELDSYIMSEKESNFKGSLWNKVNAVYLEQQKGKYRAYIPVFVYLYH